MAPDEGQNQPHARLNARFAALTRWRESHRLLGLQVLPQLAHRTEMRAQERNQKHAHRTWEWSYLERGALTYHLAAGRPVRAEAGDLVALPPGLRHHWSAEQPTLVFGFMVHLASHGEGARNLMRALTRRVEALGYRLPRLAAWGPLSAELCREAQSTESGVDEAIAAHFQLAAIAILRRLLPGAPGPRVVPSHPPRRGAADLALAERVKFIIHDQYAQRLSLAQLATQAGYSRDHLSLKFRELTGETVGRFLARYRLERARELLRNTDYSVREIAALTGYPDTAYFCRWFRHAMKETPGAYRRRTSVG